MDAFNLVESKNCLVMDAEIDNIVLQVSQVVNLLKQRDRDHHVKKLTPIYRGESKIYVDNDKPLEPGLFRRLRADENSILNYEKKLITTFLNRYPKYKFDNLITSLSIMQHYGFPTRLLDWTLQLEVALYFSCVKNLDDDGVLYVFVPTLTYDKGDGFLEPISAFQESIEHHYFEQALIPHSEVAHVDFWARFSHLANQEISDVSVPGCLAFKPASIHGVNQREQYQRSIYTFHLGYIAG